MKSRSVFGTSMVFLVMLLLGNAIPALAQQTEAVGTFIEAERTSITFDIALVVQRDHRASSQEH